MGNFMRYSMPADGCAMYVTSSQHRPVLISSAMGTRLPAKAELVLRSTGTTMCASCDANVESWICGRSQEA